VRDVSDVTGFPEMMDGRIKTLHPKIHGALLGLRDKAEHVAAMTEHGIEPIDMVVINLYPFQETVERGGVSIEEAIEQIDIGGPAMIRSAAKNFGQITVVPDVSYYQPVLHELNQLRGCVSPEFAPGTGGGEPSQSRPTMTDGFLLISKSWIRKSTRSSSILIRY
jgi:phosphoribosylaminoimidazolecarboxamide formyltransferase/IMP cyclohydrolase